MRIKLPRRTRTFRLVPKGRMVCPLCGEESDSWMPRPQWWYRLGFQSIAVCESCALGQSAEAIHFARQPYPALDDSDLPVGRCEKCRQPFGVGIRVRFHRLGQPTSDLCPPCILGREGCNPTGRELGWLGIFAPRQHNKLTGYTKSLYPVKVPPPKYTLDWLVRREEWVARCRMEGEETMGEVTEELGPGPQNLRRGAVVTREAWLEVDRFIAGCRDHERQYDFDGLERYVCQQYRLLFREEPPEEAYVYLLLAKVGYELQRRGFYTSSVGHLLSERFWKNYDAAQRLCTEDFSDQVRVKLEARQRDLESPVRERSEVPMTATATKEKKESPIQRGVGKTTALGVGQYWAHLFAENERSDEKLTDDRLATAAHKEFPDRDFHYSTSACRLKYNRGGFTDGNIPKPQSKRYDKQGDVITGRVLKPKAEGEKREAPVKRTRKTASPAEASEPATAPPLKMRNLKRQTA